VLTTFYTHTAANPAFPLLFDTSLKTASPAASIQDVVMMDTKIHLATQNERYTDTSTCATPDVVVLGGGWLLQEDDEKGGNIDLEDFLDYDGAYDQAAVETRLGQYLAGHSNMNPSTFSGIIVLDIENPNLKNLVDNGTYTETQRQQIVEAYKVRIAAANHVFDPDDDHSVKFALYGTMVADAQGRTTEPAYQTVEDRRVALGDAAAAGLFDEIDYLSPLVLPAFGCSDSASTSCVSEACDGAWGTIEAQALQAVVESRAIANVDLPLLPITSPRIYNPSNSSFDGDLILDLDLDDPLDVTHGTQLDVFIEQEVEDVAVWIANPAPLNQEMINEPNCGDWVVDSYTCAY
jgi:hypothetical protein